MVLGITSGRTKYDDTRWRHKVGQTKQQTIKETIKERKDMMTWQTSEETPNLQVHGNDDKQ